MAESLIIRNLSWEFAIREMRGSLTFILRFVFRTVASILDNYDIFALNEVRLLFINAFRYL